MSQYYCFGRTIIQKGSRHHSNAERRVQSQNGSCGSWVGQSGLDTGVPPSTTSFSSQFHYIGATCLIIYIYFFSLWRCDAMRVMVSSFLRFLDHTQRRTSVGRTPLDEWSARRRDLYLTTHNTHNRQTSMPPVGFKPTISAGERPQAARLKPRGRRPTP